MGSDLDTIHLVGQYPTPSRCVLRLAPFDVVRASLVGSDENTKFLYRYVRYACGLSIYIFGSSLSDVVVRVVGD